VIDNTYRLIIITPVYEDLDASSRLFEELSELYGDSVFVVAVDDGSLNQPIDEKILNLADVSGVVLSQEKCWTSKSNRDRFKFCLRVCEPTSKNSYYGF
jgi:hypothetical protein